MIRHFFIIYNYRAHDVQMNKDSFWVQWAHLSSQKIIKLVNANYSYNLVWGQPKSLMMKLDSPSKIKGHRFSIKNKGTHFTIFLLKPS